MVETKVQIRACDKCRSIGHRTPATYRVVFSSLPGQSSRSGWIHDHASLHLCSEHYDEASEDQRKNPDSVVHSVTQIQHNPL